MVAHFTFGWMAGRLAVDHLVLSIFFSHPVENIGDLSDGLSRLLLLLLARRWSRTSPIIDQHIYWSSEDAKYTLIADLDCMTIRW